MILATRQGWTGVCGAAVDRQASHGMEEITALRQRLAAAESLLTSLRERLVRAEVQFAAVPQPSERCGASRSRFSHQAATPGAISLSNLDPSLQQILASAPPLNNHRRHPREASLPSSADETPAITAQSEDHIVPAVSPAPASHVGDTAEYPVPPDVALPSLTVKTAFPTLESDYEIETFVFHCTGAGGRAMERLVSEGVLEAVLDVTTTEICDQICGGVMDAGPFRLEAPLKAGIPYVVSVGATDMVNFGPKATVPEKYQNRKLYEHNPTVTLMRTSPEECKAIGEFMVEKLNKFCKDKSKVQVVVPLGGVSMIATPDSPFYDGEADEALFSALRAGLKDSDIQLAEDRRAINDEGFAVDLAKRLISLMGLD